MSTGDFAGARALLVGTGTHASSSDLPAIPAVAATLDDLRAALLERCGLAEVRVELDPASPTAVGAAVSAAAASAEGPLIVYYVGHGLVSRRGSLFLASAITHSGPLHLEHTALPYDTVRRYLLDNVRGPVLVVLDCCFSGRAIEGMAGPWEEVAGLAEISGAYVLTSAGRSEPAFAPGGLRHTAFSGALLRLLADGDPLGPPRLALQDVHRHLSRVLPASGFPRPRARSTGRVGELVLAANPAHVLAAEGVRLSLALPEGSPYKGLEPFGAADAALFFGRERLVQTLARQLGERYADPAPLIVTGPSGSGKTSLLRAGLVPAIGQGALGLPGSADWRVTVITPADPVPPDADVLVVDQFEEAFVGGDPGFAAAVCAHRGLVVLGVRADFLGRCAERPELRRALERGQVVVGPMNAAELRAAVERPARAAGYTLESGLADVLLRDLGEEAGRLPLLSHALLATWQQRQGSTLTVAGYRRTGGIHAALAATADDVLASLDFQARDSARALFRRLVHVGEGTDDTRRRVDLDRLLGEVPDPLAACEVVDAFAADSARLLTLDGGTVAITHEALLTAWPVLRSWIDSDRAGLLVEQHLVEAAGAWDGEPAGLYRGSRLEMAADWAEGRRLAPAAHAFLEASLALRRREALAARRRVRRRAALSGVLATLLVISLVAGVVAVLKYRDAEWQRRVASVRAMMFEADALRERDPLTALRLSVAAVGLDDSAETRAHLIATLVANHAASWVARYPSVVGSVALSPSGPLTAAIVGPAGVAELYDLASSKRLAALPGKVGHVAFSPDGGLLIAAGADTALWDVRTPAEPVRLARLSGHGPAAFRPTGGLAVVGGRRGVARLWDLRDPRKPKPLTPLRGDALAVSWSADGRHLLAGDERHGAVLWDLSDPVRPARRLTLRAEEPWGGVAKGLALSPDGRTAALTGAGNGVDVWDLTRKTRLYTLQGHDYKVRAVAFGHDGRTLITAGLDRRIVRWDLSGRAEPRRLFTVGGQDGWVLALDLRADLLLTGDTAGTVRLWDIADAATPRALRRYPGSFDGIRSAAFSPNGADLLTGTTDDGALIWRAGKDTPLRGTAPWVEQVAYAGSSAVTSHPLALWDGPAGHPLGGTADLLAVSADGTALLTAAKGRLRLWDVAARKTTWEFSAPYEPRSLALSPDGRTAAVGDDEGGVSLWDLFRRVMTRREVTHGDEAVLSVAFSADGGRLLSGGDNKIAVLWDARRLERLAVLRGHSDGVRAVAFHPRGDLALTVGDDETAMIWLIGNPATPYLVGRLAGAIRTGVFSPDGRSALTGSVEGGATLWDVGPLDDLTARPIEMACTIIGRSFDTENWPLVSHGAAEADPCA